jgi:hypothetical protein
MKLKTATLLAIFGAAGMAITFALDWMFRKMGVTVEFYDSIEPLLISIQLIGRFLIMIFFIILYKNQK